MPVFEQGEPERFGAVDEQATATVLLILDNPIVVAVLANKEEVRFRGRFLLAFLESGSGLFRPRR
jgi:hypothetical protein